MTFLCIALLVCPGFVSAEGGIAFRRGDADANGVLELTDAVLSLGFLFLGTEAPPCDDAADTNDDGIVDLSDPVGVLNFLFIGGSPPADPFPDCCDDPTTDDLDCVSYPVV